MKKGFTAFNLDSHAKQLVFTHFTAKFNNVLAHHVTYQFGVTEDSPIPDVKEVMVIGYAEDEHAQAAIVEVNGSSVRESDGKTYHITISHDSTVKPFYSNQLIEKGYKKIKPFIISVKAVFNPF